MSRGADIQKMRLLLLIFYLLKRLFLFGIFWHWGLNLIHFIELIICLWRRLFTCKPFRYISEISLRCWLVFAFFKFYLCWNDTFLWLEFCVAWLLAVWSYVRRRVFNLRGLLKFLEIHSIWSVGNHWLQVLALLSFEHRLVCFLYCVNIFSW